MRVSDAADTGWTTRDDPNVPRRDRVRFDNRYIDQCSLFLDVVIALQTIGSRFRSKQSS